MRRFMLQRRRDISGVSGKGIVAEGVEFSDGHCAIRWLVAPCSTQLHDNIAVVEAVHGHGGATHIEFVDLTHTSTAKKKRGK